MTKSKIITIDDTPDSVAGRLPGFCATNPAGISITVEQERAPRGLIYFRVHCGDKKAASALLELRAEQGRCVIGWGWQHGITVLGKPGNRGDLQRCKDFCAKFLTHLAAMDSMADAAVPMLKNYGQAPGAAAAVAQVDTKSEERKLCEQWAARDVDAPLMPEFLSAHSTAGHGFYTVSLFKRALKRASSNGWIKKVNGRWRPAE